MEKLHKLYTVDEAAKYLRCSTGTVSVVCSKGLLPGAWKLNNKWIISGKSLKALFQMDIDIAMTKDGYSVFKLKEAGKKLKTIHKYNQLKYVISLNGKGLTRASRLAAKECGVGLTTMFRWRRNYTLKGIIGLIDTRGKLQKKRN